MPTTDSTHTLALIELAERVTPFCDCGEPMAPVARNSQIWLECAAQPEASGGPLRRLVATLAASGHTHRLLVDAA